VLPMVRRMGFVEGHDGILRLHGEKFNYQVSRPMAADWPAMGKFEKIGIIGKRIILKKQIGSTRRLR
jgi:hypothetical protein